MSDFEQRLICLSECDGREDVIKQVLDSLPAKLYFKRKDFVQCRALLGLADVLRYNSPRIHELDVRLEPLGHHYSYAMTRLAHAVQQHSHVHTLRLRWSSDQLLSHFLAVAFGSNQSVSTLKIYDDSGLERDNITATVWSNFWAARRGMQHVDVFAFTKCRNAALVSSVIVNAPVNATELTLNECTLDMTAMQELSRKMEDAASIRIINLQAVRFRKPDFSHVARGIKHSRSLLTLRLNASALDAGSVTALAEALKFNRSLVTLDLSINALDGDACKALGLALALNKTIHELVLFNCSFADNGLDDLQRMKRENVVLVGVPPPRTGRHAGDDDHSA